MSDATPEAVEHKDVPLPPHWMGEQYYDQWVACLWPYPSTWHCELALGHLRDAFHMRHRADQAREILEREGMTALSPQGGRVAHPMVAVERQAVSTAKSSMKAFEERVEALAPRDGKGHRRPYDLLPGAGKAPNAVDYWVEGDEDEDDLLLGGQGNRLRNGH